MTNKDIRTGDLVIYRSGKRNYANHPENYARYFKQNLKHRRYDNLDIMEIRRYVKFLWFYRLKTVYKRSIVG